MSNLRELSYKEISYIRSALEICIGQLELDVAADDIDDDDRIDLQEDIMFYENILYTFKKSEKQSVDLKEVQSIAIKTR